jgi:hypothetical protein
MIINNIEIKPEWSSNLTQQNLFCETILTWRGDEPLTKGDTFVLSSIVKNIKTKTINIELIRREKND